MIDVATAWQRINNAMPRRPGHRIPVSQAAGMITAQPVCAERDQPPFDRVMMDGVAIAAATVARSFPLQGTQAAGATRQRLRPGHAIEVMTGAVMPEGADTVIPVEQIIQRDGKVALHQQVDLAPGQYIHRQGSDYRAGSVLLPPGSRIDAPGMAVLVSSGLKHVEVASPPGIAVAAVGDELVAPGVPIRAEQVRRSNDYAIATLLQHFHLEVQQQACLPDDPAVLRRELGQMIARHDVIVLSGGVSMGKFDYIPEIMKELGVRIIFHKVAQRPGKPMWFGMAGETAVFALPGNPVSALVCARRYVVPAVLASMGHEPRPEKVSLHVAGAPAGLTWFAPLAVTPEGPYRTVTTNTSGDFYTLTQSVGFAEISEGTQQPGQCLAPFWRWS